jgi:hypothetical protein
MYVTVGGVNYDDVKTVRNSWSANTWYHITFTFDGSTFKIYVNGVLENSVVHTGTMTSVTGYDIGGSPGLTSFPGLIDEVRIYNRALSAEEIQALYQAKARLDYGDIRFTDSDGSTLLNYWQEADGRFWVKVPSIPASSTKTIYVYYGNPSATSLSNGDATFEFFDDFIGSSINTTKWDTSGVTIVSVSNSILAYRSNVAAHRTIPYKLSTFSNIAIRVKEKSDGTNPSIGVMFRKSTSTGSSYDNLYYNGYGPGVAAYADTHLIDYVFGGINYNIVNQRTGVNFVAGAWYYIELAGYGSTLTSRLWDSNYNLISNLTATNNLYSSGYAGLYSRWNDKTHYVDYVFARKYTSPEPTTSVGTEEILSASNFVYTQSPAVSSNPSATYTCPSCQYSSNTYYGVAYSVNESVWTAFTAVKTFTCKMEASQSGSCACSSNTQCYNPCNVNWGTYYDGYCYNSKCYDAIPGSAFGLTQSCFAGTFLNHETSSGRHANVNGRLYYCKGSDNSVSPYPFVFNLSPGSSVGNCKCKQDGSWSCPSGIIPIRGGRIKIV